VHENKLGRLPVRTPRCARVLLAKKPGKGIRFERREASTEKRKEHYEPRGFWLQGEEDDPSGVGEQWKDHLTAGGA